MFIIRKCNTLNELGISMNISVQSMTTHVEGYNSLKHMGIVLLTDSLDGQMGYDRNLECKKSIHVMKILDI